MKPRSQGYLSESWTCVLGLVGTNASASSHMSGDLKAGRLAAELSGSRVAGQDCLVRSQTLGVVLS